MPHLSLRAIMLRLQLLIVLLAWSTAWAGNDALPQPVQAALRQADIPAGHVGVVVWETGKPGPLLTHGGALSFNPASTMKLVTSYAALELLGPAYTWKTELYTDGSLVDGVLTGNLYIKGYGDPQLTLERFWLLLRELRSRGVREIRGDLVLDQSYFSLSDADPARFDGEPRRAYNAVPAALMVNFNSTMLRLTALSGGVAAYADPLPPGMRLVNKLQLDNTPCGEWRDRIDIEWLPDNGNSRLVLNGSYAAACGEKSTAFNLGDASAAVADAFGTLWQESGGRLAGSWRVGEVPASAQRLMVFESPPLADVVRGLNKFSNNVMARSLFLSLGAVRGGAPGTTQKSADAVRNWLAGKGLHFPELVLENGSGLSRIERISPHSMAQLLLAAYSSPIFSELESALPIAAVDGTMKSRDKDTPLAGHAHIKTGTLEGVKTIAGYVSDKAGRRFVVVFFINDTNAAAGGAAQDALLEWVYGGR
ncbi:D-alanyl-D-alanine carboxypeptidase [Sulfuriferula plumbiphila]|uniref:D-alanyl-D-alanine carboxypeptidase n=2 Tax=Sulfuriferula plumbiphila TaxID=171865 RepID=A0A512L543_9PROT|nr:D-alanyl-D-alanine carboxypeptidase [Sulfuriferula plumbiphila]GEP29582.1 D-alanyl-D-alanine carboxypeptidase [Sulfuriferula plumbiphila]